MKARNTRSSGFTLIELLVVISIISVLMAILLPAMSGSRKEARKTQCLTRLRELYLAHVAYVNTEDKFPAMNNMEDDGTWQYNYLVWDGFDFDNNFGPLVHNIPIILDTTILNCPVQEDPFHKFGTAPNPWPAMPLMDTRAGYGRRYHVSGKSFSQMRTKALLADVLHLPSVVLSAHVTGVNVAYTDGHAKWVRDTGILTDNELSHPFDIMDNEIVDDIWDMLDANQ